jgi:general stress protein CsbA
MEKYGWGLMRSIWINTNFQNFFLRLVAIILLAIILIVDFLTVKYDSMLLQIVIVVLSAIAGYDVYKLMKGDKDVSKEQS